MSTLVELFRNRFGLMNCIFTIPHQDPIYRFYLKEIGVKDLAAFEYLRSGYCIAKILSYIARSVCNERKIIDYGSGFGRVTRFLIGEGFKVVALDIKEEALDFQKSTFGVTTAIPPLRMDRVSFVTAISLFTHLPPEIALNTIEKIVNSLAENGVFVFSTNNVISCQEKLSKYCFKPYSEDESLSPNEYGTTWFEYGFLLDFIKSLGGNAHFIPRALGGYQDLWVVSKEPREINILPEPIYFVEKLQTNEEGNLIIDGWITVGRGKIKNLIFVTQKFDVPFRLYEGREDVILFTGIEKSKMFRLLLPKNSLALDDPFLIVAKVENEMFPIVGGYVGSYLTYILNLKLREKSREAEYYRSQYEKLVKEYESLGWDKFCLEARLSAVYNSKFFKAKSVWDKIKNFFTSNAKSSK